MKEINPTNTIMKTNFYSALPRFAKALYWYEQ